MGQPTLGSWVMIKRKYKTDTKDIQRDVQIKYKRYKKMQHKKLWDTPSWIHKWWYVAKEEKCFCRRWCMKWILRPSKQIQKYKKNWNKYNHLMMKEIRLRGWVWRCAPSHPLRFPSRRSCSRRKRHSVALPMSFDRNVTNALISTDKEYDENAHSGTP